MEARSYFLPGIEPTEFADREFGPGEDRVTLRCPIVTRGLLTNVAGRITQARDAYLSSRPSSQIIAAIDSAVQRWLDPSYPLRQEAEALMPVVTGYSTQMVRRGLPELLAPFRREGLTALLEAELGDPQLLDDGRAQGSRLTTCILAGNIPVVAVGSIVHSLLLKSACLVKSSSGDPIFPVLFARSLAEADPELASALAVVWWQGGSEEVERAAFDVSGAVVVSGNDATIDSLKPLISPPARFVGYGHRISFAAIGREKLAQSTAKALAAKTAWDVGFFDQQGCVSPQAIYVEQRGKVAPSEFAEILAREMAQLEKRLPRGRLALEEASAIQQARAAWELRQAANDGLRLFRSDGSTAWTIVYEETPTLQPTCLNRTIRIVPIGDLSALPSAVAPMGRYLQTAGLAVSRKRLAPLASALASVGVSRVCPIGRMQYPPASWPHDGLPNLLNLVTWADDLG